ncbi:MAG: DUF2834 domain-containing protein [Bacteroidota bacterium]
MNSRTHYLVLAILGTLLPYGLWAHFLVTNDFSVSAVVETLMNPLALALLAELVVASVVFWIYMARQAAKYDIPHLWMFITLNIVVGLSCAWPLFMYVRRGRINTLMAIQGLKVSV